MHAVAHHLFPWEWGKGLNTLHASLCLAGPWRSHCIISVDVFQYLVPIMLMRVCSVSVLLPHLMYIIALRKYDPLNSHYLGFFVEQFGQRCGAAVYTYAQ